MASYDEKNVNDMLGKAGGKLGMDKNQLKSALENGDIGKITQNMRPQDAQKLQKLLQNPQLASQIMNSPQVQALLKKLMGGEG